MRQHQRNTEILRELLASNSYELREKPSGDNEMIHDSYKCEVKITDNLSVLVEFTQDDKDYLKV